MYAQIIRTDKAPSRFPADADLLGVLETVARGTDTRSLVVDIFLLPDCNIWRGDCRRPARPSEPQKGVMGPQVVNSGASRALQDYPDIRIILGDKWLGGGEITTRYGMGLRCGGFADFLAFLFAHELHHYRRYFLGLHPGEGEISADKWALECVRQAGFQVQGGRVSAGRKRRVRVAAADLRVVQDLMAQGQREGMSLPEILEAVGKMDAHSASRDVAKALHYEQLRQLPPNARLRVCRAGSAHHDAMYVGQVVHKVRTPRRGSYRMPIRFADGREFYWPMEWLEVVQQ